MKTIFIAASILAASSAIAQSKPAWNPDIPSVRLAKCTVQEVTSRMMMQGISGAADVANGQLPIFEELKRINAKAKDDKRPVGEQLSRPDVVRFAELAQRLKVGQLGIYIESRRERDAKALQRMVELADGEWRFARNDVEGEDAALRDVLHAMRELAKKHQNWPRKIDVTSRSCSFDFALKALSDQAFANIASANAESSEIITAYNYAIDLRNLAWLAQAMDMNYRAMKQDVIAGGGEVGHIGKTADRMLADGEISPQQQMGFRAIGVINEKISADVVEDWSNFADTAKRP